MILAKIEKSNAVETQKEQATPQGKASIDGLPTRKSKYPKKKGWLAKFFSVLREIFVERKFRKHKFLVLLIALALVLISYGIM